MEEKSEAPAPPLPPAPPPIPLLRRARRAFSASWPLVTWLAAVASAAWLYPRADTHGEALAWAEVIEVGITPEVPGRIASMALEIGQEVHEGDPAATLDASDLDEKLRVARAEADRRPGEGGASRRVAFLDSKRGTGVRVSGDPLEDERVRIEMDRVTAEQKADRGELAALLPEIDRLHPLVEKHLVPPDRLDEMVVKRGLLEKRISARAEELDQLKRRLAVSTTEALRLGELEVAEMERQRRKFQLFVPTAGRVSSIAHRPGEWVQAGAAVASVMIQRPGRLVAYITDRQVPLVRVGTAATVRPKTHAGAALPGKVVALGPTIEDVPLRLRFVPTVVQWGRRVTIEIPPSAEIVPGAIYSVRFQP